MRLKIYEKIRFGYFFVFLAVSSVICQPVHLFNTPCGLKVFIKKGLIKENCLGKNLAEQLFIFPNKRKNLSLNTHFLSLPKR